MTAALRADATSGFIAVNGVDRLTVGSDGILTATAKPNQFDSSLKLATTSFVDEAVGNFRGYVVYTASTVLTAADAGKLVRFNVANGTLTLPLGSSVDVGTTYNIIFSNATGMKLAASGTDLVSSGGAQVAMPVLNAYGTQTQATWRGDMWELHSGSIQNEFEAALTQATTGVTGWKRLPGGLIIQWGSGDPSSSDITITYPIAFPNAVLNLQATSGYSPGAGSGSTGYVSVGYTSVANGKTQFVARLSNPALGWFWVAIGR